MRFFERVKIERHIQRLERLAAGGSLSEAQAAELERWKRDLLVGARWHSWAGT